MPGWLALVPVASAEEARARFGDALVRLESVLLVDSQAGLSRAEASVEGEYFFLVHALFFVLRRARPRKRGWLAAGLAKTAFKHPERQTGNH